MAVYMSVHHVLAWCLQRPSEGIGLSETRVIDRHWKLNLCPLAEQSVLLITGLSHLLLGVPLDCKKGTLSGPITGRYAHLIG